MLNTHTKSINDQNFIPAYLYTIYWSCANSTSIYHVLIHTHIQQKYIENLRRIQIESSLVQAGRVARELLSRLIAWSEMSCSWRSAASSRYIGKLRRRCTSCRKATSMPRQGGGRQEGARRGRKQGVVGDALEARNLDGNGGGGVP